MHSVYKAYIPLFICSSTVTDVVMAEKQTGGRGFSSELFTSTACNLLRELCPSFECWVSSMLLLQFLCTLIR